MKEKSLRVGITGPISDINFGDYAMLVNNIYDIGVKNIVLFSYNETFSEKLLNDYFPQFDINIINVLLKKDKSETPTINIDLISKLKKRIKLIILKYLIRYQVAFKVSSETPLELLSRVDNFDFISNQISNIDVLVVNGGGYFNQLWNSWGRRDDFIKILIPILIANQQHKKIVFTANGIGPFDEGKEFFRYFFNYLINTSLAVRDRTYSLSYLTDIGIDKNVVKFLPDDLYIINKEILNKPISHGIKVKKYIVMEIYFPVSYLIENKLDIIEFSNFLYISYGISILFLPFDFAKGGLSQGKYLESILDHFELYDIEKTGYVPIQDAYSIIKNAEMVLCTRYHGLVLSLSAGIPVINIVKDVCGDKRYYFNKSYGCLQAAFNGINFNELNYLKMDFLETLKYIQSNFLAIIEMQKNTYNQTYDNNKIELAEIRRNYLLNIKNPQK